MNENEDPQDGPAPATGEPLDAAALAAERDDYLARWQRAAADYQNLKRRSASEVEHAVRRSLEGLLAGLLLVVDHLDLALSSPSSSDDARALAEGVRLTRDQLLATLRAEGVEPIAEGGAFDPALHEAVATLERADLEPGQVVDTLRRGYTWRGQVLRAAQVRVSREPQGAQGGG
ncbi:MAG TPA: nucleotide exchange factor GrpE [Planctomycetota bacterium]|nr:nucleotide exchange factor GrpE [Planctomycetota bacterium]